MNRVVETALDLWGLRGATYSLVAARENAVFKVVTDTQTLALRLHRKGYRSDQELWSELKWMEVASIGCIRVPNPIRARNDKVMHHVEGVQVDVLTWLSGAPLADIFDALGSKERSELFFAVGRQMAKLHEISDAWIRPPGFQRCSWDTEGLLGYAPLWGRFWENPALSDKDRKLFLDFHAVAQADLAQMKGVLDYGLIHADLVGANIMIDGEKVQLIDFDDGGFGYRLFDIATTLLKFTEEEDYGHLHAALIQGYNCVRTIDISALNLFLALRAATYVGWNISRISEDKSGARNVRFISTAKTLASGYLANR